MDRASDYFDRIVADYDSLIERAVPRYHEMQQCLLEALPQTAIRVLELGCGTGNLTRDLRRRYADADLVVVDAAPHMLEVTQSRLEAPLRTKVVCSLFEDLALEPASFDLVTSCISLHHVVDKEALFKSLHGWLRVGGSLVYADQMRGATHEQHARNVHEMLEFWREPGHLTVPEQTDLLLHDAQHDHHVTVEEQFAWMRAAGFVHPDCVWRRGMWGVLSALKV